MGCISSKEPKEGPGVEAEHKKQRRRLSVAPQHVGDEKESATTTESQTSAAAALTNLEKEARGTWEHSTLTKKGVVPYSKKKVNQDRAIVKYAVGGDADVSLFGVMDGHGEFGHSVSTWVEEQLPIYLEKEQSTIKTSTEKAILDAVRDMCAELPKTKINIAFSGTTCVFGVTVKNRIFVANIGDSRCVLCRQISDGIESIDLSEDQKPENPGEKERIMLAGGRVEPLPGPPGEDCGPQRVWLAEVDVPGLAMSRSIGDEVSQTVGVISVPEVVAHDITEDDLFIIWASDGVWEFISSEEAIKLVYAERCKSGDYKTAAQALVDESVARWKKEEEVIDDITCVIVGFNKSKNFPAA